ncbi:hypothetical protein CC1G_08264 [Coprinopsis cinerea okayama7|uniref:Uncharacterized protein n=1 Tax=Coprinopsis cinerea (strain Okayama-7 / 130 / ATCC MYA-4618 / FGSC 9003) TaxID=240176 RepID=A8PG16_COPC7|nr:hypothetical protein CC1G_08264 [Coprinopsis cinerea okayama7\|eukprot:XP_001841120.2 hypothetical protein CC1G_08264 [Coprinopsis cinerea okayama7\
MSSQPQPTSPSSQMVHNALTLDDHAAAGVEGFCKSCDEAVNERKMPTCHAPSDPGLALFKPLPSNCDSRPSYMVYGFPVTKSIIAKALKAIGLKDNPRSNMMMSAAHLGMYLEARVGYTTGNLAYYVGKADPQAEVDGVALDIDGKRAVELLVVSATGERRLYRQRPTVKQFKKLEEYLGEARWFEAMEPRSQFPAFPLENLPKLPPDMLGRVWKKM